MGQGKVREVNLERGFPTADTAVREMVNQLSTCKRAGCRAVILIHGYGSSGVGGKIKMAVKSKLREPSLSGIVRLHCGGEDWIHRKREILAVCGKLGDFEVRVAGNPGVTVVILK